MTDNDPTVAASDTSFDHALDARQRHMLEAMGIKLWLPEQALHGAAHETVHGVSHEAAHGALHKAAHGASHDAAHTAAPPSLSAHAPAPQGSRQSTPRSDSPAISKQKQPLAGIEYAQSAIESVASQVRSVTPSPFAPVAPSSAIALSPRPAGIEHMDWTALQNAVSSCQACALCASRKNTVFGIGPASSDTAHAADVVLAPQVDWLVVGEAPGEHEDAQGEPFVGQSGKLLDNMLAAMKIGVGEDGKQTGLSRQRSVYIANVIKCRPPDNRNPSAEEIATCAPYLARQVELLRPKIIVAVGKFAISTVTGSNEPVGKLRGRVHALKHANYAAPVIVTYHPAYLLRNLPDKAKAWADLMLAMQTYSELLSSALTHTDQQA